MLLNGSAKLSMAMYGATGTGYVHHTQSAYPVEHPVSPLRYVHRSDVRVDSLLVNNPDTGESEVISGYMLPSLEFHKGCIDETIELFGYRHRIHGSVDGTIVRLNTTTEYPDGRDGPAMITNYGIRYTTHHEASPPKYKCEFPMHNIGLAMRRRR